MRAILGDLARVVQGRSRPHTNSPSHPGNVTQWDVRTARGVLRKKAADDTARLSACPDRRLRRSYWGSDSLGVRLAFVPERSAMAAQELDLAPGSTRMDRLAAERPLGGVAQRTVTAAVMVMP